jgi:signal transduction histidine kinase
MLYEFIEANRDEVITRARGMVASRPWPMASTDELANGIPLFLTQLTQTLRTETGPEPFPDRTIGNSAARHGRDLLAKGFTVSQVVHDYGDVCQSITGLATERQEPVSVDEFHTLNRCLDTAIAESVTEFARLREEATAHLEAERVGQAAHELRNKLQTALLAYHALKTGTVGITGSTGLLLGRSLLALRDLIDATLVEVRLAAPQPRRDRVKLKGFIEELTLAAGLHAELREISLVVEPVDPALEAELDAPLLASAVDNLLQNGFKYTRERGRVCLRTSLERGRILIEVEDQCGGLPERAGTDPALAPASPRPDGRSGLGFGLSISRRAVEANGGQLRTRNLPGRGCIYQIDLPSAPPRG